MFIETRNKDAETAFAMAMKLFGAENYSEHTKSAIWAECHNNEELQRLVRVYTYATPSYAPMALYKAHTKLVEVFG